MKSFVLSFLFVLLGTFFLTSYSWSGGPRDGQPDSKPPVLVMNDKEAIRFIYKLLKEKKFSDKICNISELEFHPETSGRDSDDDTVIFTIGKIKEWYLFPSDFSFSIEAGDSDLKVLKIDNEVREINYKSEFAMTNGYRSEESIFLLLDKMNGWQLKAQKKEWFEGSSAISTHELRCQFEN